MKPISTKLRERVYNIIDTFEYNFIIILFWVWSPAIFGYAILNFKLVNTDSILNKFSFVVSIIYVVLYLVFLTVFLIAFAS